MPIIEFEQRGIGPVGRRVIEASHFCSYQIAKRFPRAVPCVCVLGYPRSGTVWASQMIADYLQLPYPILSFFPIGCPAVFHGHQLVERKGPRSVYVMRDGRDAIVSLYFHLKRAVPNADLSAAPRRLRRCFPGATDLDDISGNLPAFIEKQCTAPVGASHSWAEHVGSLAASGRQDVPVMRYERMKSDCEQCLADAMEHLVGAPPDPERIRESVDRFSFARQSGRQPGAEDAQSFIRKGTTGDWANHFTCDAAEVFDRYCGDALLEMGYEQDRSWIKRVGQPTPEATREPSRQAP